jgi:hypothetical protein
VRVRAAEHRDGATRIEADIHAVVEDAAKLDVIADRAAAQLAGLFRGRLALRVTLPVRHIDALVEQANELAGIVAVPGWRVVGEFVRRNEINAADLCHIHTDLLRRMLDHALGEIGGLRTSGAAIGTRLRRVREQAFAHDVDCLNVIGFRNEAHRE